MAKVTVTTLGAVLALFGIITFLGLDSLNAFGFLPFEIPKALLIAIIFGAAVLLFETRDDAGKVAVYQVLLSLAGIIIAGSAIFFRTEIHPTISAIVGILLAVQLVKEIFT